MSDPLSTSKTSNDAYEHWYFRTEKIIVHEHMGVLHGIYEIFSLPLPSPLSPSLSSPFLSLFLPLLQ